MIASGDGYIVSASRRARRRRFGSSSPTATAARPRPPSTRVLVPVNGAPTAADASATVVAGESVDIALPASDPEGERLEYEIVDAPEHGRLQMRAAGRSPRTRRT